MKRVKELKKRLAEIQELEAKNTGLPEHKVKILKKIAYVNELRQQGEDVSIYEESEKHQSSAITPSTHSAPRLPDIQRVQDESNDGDWQLVTRGKKAAIAKPQEPVFLAKALTKIVQTRPDGSCLFQAIGHWINMSETEVRKKVVRWLSENASFNVGDLEISVWIEAEEGIRFPAYLNRLKLPETWGGQSEIFAASQQFRINIFVWCDEQISDRWSLQHEFVVPNPRATAYILFVGGHHYDVLTLTEAAARQIRKQ